MQSVYAQTFTALLACYTPHSVVQIYKVLSFGFKTVDKQVVLTV